MIMYKYARYLRFVMGENSIVEDDKGGNSALTEQNSIEVDSNNNHKVGGNESNSGRVGQEQVHSLLFSDKLSWQAIIYDLISTEQLDVWDVDISLLAERFLEKVQDLEEANFFVSSKVLLAAALLFRMKSEILLSEDIKGLDDVLFGRGEEKKKYLQERIELEDEVPELVPRTPLPRFRKVSLQDLMRSLGKAIQTESRRIKRVVVARQHEIEAGISLPKARVNIRDEIRLAYRKLKELFEHRDEKISFSEYVSLGSNSGVDNKVGKEERVSGFVPLLHLDQQERVVLEQEGHLEEIYIWTKKLYEQKNKALLELMRKEAAMAMEEELEDEKSTGVEGVKDVEGIETAEKGFDVLQTGGVVEGNIGK
jgi:segregation and condensation protein A